MIIIIFTIIIIMTHEQPSRLGGAPTLGDREQTPSRGDTAWARGDSGRRFSPFLRNSIGIFGQAENTFVTIFLFIITITIPITPSPSSDMNLSFLGLEASPRVPQSSFEREREAVKGRAAGEYLSDIVGIAGGE